MTGTIDHTSCVVNAPPRLDADSWTAFLPMLGSALERVTRHSRACVVITAPEKGDAFVQFGVTAAGLVLAEASGTVRRSCCRGRHEVREAQRARLVSLGWRSDAIEHDGRVIPLWVRPVDSRWHSPAALYS